jgi:hypothetical protein
MAKADRCAEVSMSVTTSQSPYAVIAAGRAATRRLIVLVTEQDRDLAESPHQIWEWAAGEGLQVLLLGLYAHEDEEARLRRLLVSMAAAIRDSRISVEFRLEAGHDWMGQIRANWRPGDVLACLEGEDIGIGLPPLDQIMRSSFGAPVYLLTDRTVKRRRTERAGPSVVSAGGSIVVVVAFFLLQIRIVEMLHDWGQTALLSMSVLFEMLLIWAWDSLTA